MMLLAFFGTYYLLQEEYQRCCVDLEEIVRSWSDYMYTFERDV